MATKTKKKVAPLATEKTYERLRLREWVVFWILVLVNMALICAIFGNVDVNTLKPVSVVNDEQQNAEQALVDELKAQVKSLSDQVASIESDPVVEVDDSSDMDGLCPAKDAAPIDSYLTYKLGDVSVQVPYSTGWTNPNCQLPPATVSSDGEVLAFGPALTDVHL